MMKPRLRVNYADSYVIESWGNGLVYEIVRRVDGATVFLQGDDTLILERELAGVGRGVTEADVLGQYFP